MAVEVKDLTLIDATIALLNLALCTARWTFFS